MCLNLWVQSWTELQEQSLSIMEFSIDGKKLYVLFPLSESNTDGDNHGRNQVVRMLIIVVGVFALLWLPQRGLLLYNTIAAWNKDSLYYDLWFLMFSKTCIYINSAINPILYNVLSSKFRSSFKKAICGNYFEPNILNQLVWLIWQEFTWVLKVLMIVQLFLKFPQF